MLSSRLGSMRAVARSTAAAALRRADVAALAGVVFATFTPFAVLALFGAPVRRAAAFDRVDFRGRLGGGRLRLAIVVLRARSTFAGTPRRRGGRLVLLSHYLGSVFD